MAINLSIGDLFEQAFGYNSGAFGRNGAPYYGKDANGMEYYLPVTLQPLTGQQETPVELPHPIVAISCRKTIIETPLTERRGTVKEVVMMQDYEITIKGLIIGENDEYPEAMVQQLRDLFELNSVVLIVSVITDIFLIGNNTSGEATAVIKDISFPEVKGVKNVRPYQITLVSDTPFDLIELE